MANVWDCDEFSSKFDEVEENGFGLYRVSGMTLFYQLR
jgi:hypothetical protein